jgi:transcriptional regulator NrdR family protein
MTRRRGQLSPADLPCPACKERAGSGVVDTRGTPDGWTWRRRKCKACGARWNTLEIPEELMKFIARLPPHVKAANETMVQLYDALAKVLAPPD